MDGTRAYGFTNALLLSYYLGPSAYFLTPYGYAGTNVHARARTHMRMSWRMELLAPVPTRPCSDPLLFLPDPLGYSFLEGLAAALCS